MNFKTENHITWKFSSLRFEITLSASFTHLNTNCLDIQILSRIVESIFLQQP